MQIRPLRRDSIVQKAEVPRRDLDGEFKAAQLRSVVNLSTREADCHVLPSVGGDSPVADQKAGIVDLGEDLTLETGDSTSIRDEGIEEIGWKDFEARLP
jgi:hypothetical protein